MGADDTPDSLNLDLLAASLRASHGDLDTFVEGLAAKLEEALPGRVAVSRRRKGLFGPKGVDRISVDAGEQRLELARTGIVMVTRRARVSGGIVLKTEPMQADAWFAALSEALAAEAHHNELTRNVIERLLLG
jgi:hypothetical protein